GQEHACCEHEFPLCHVRFESARQDLNLRPPGPQPGALPDCATPRGALNSERATGIEPAPRAWKAPVHPQHFAREAPVKRTSGGEAGGRTAGTVTEATLPSPRPPH